MCTMLRFDVMTGSPLHNSLHPAHKTPSPFRVLVHSCTRSKPGHEEASLTNSVSVANTYSDTLWKTYSLM